MFSTKCNCFIILGIYAIPLRSIYKTCLFRLQISFTGDESYNYFYQSIMRYKKNYFSPMGIASIYFRLILYVCFREKRGRLSERTRSDSNKFPYLDFFSKSMTGKSSLSSTSSFPPMLEMDPDVLDDEITNNFQKQCYTLEIYK